MTTNIQTNLSELQERNREKYDQFLDECNNPPTPPNRNAGDYSQGWNDALLNLKNIGLENFTTDSFKAGALAVIGGIKKELGEEVTVFPGAEHYMTERELADEKQRIFGMNYRRNMILDYLTTLEATLKDPTPSTDVIRE